MKKVIAAFMTAVITLTFLTLPCPAAENKKVRVGFYDFPYFQEIDEDGNYSGYSYEYLQAIAQFTGWEYEYVTTATSSECLELLKNGEIDLMGVVQRTPEREAIYDYPELSSGFSASLLVTDKNDLRYAYEDFDSFDSMTIGIQKNFARNRGLSDYCQKKQFSVKTITFDTKEDMLKAIAAKTIDAALISSNQNSPDYRVIAKFAPSEVYYITTKGNQRVLDGLNKALEKLKMESPNFNTELYKKYYDFSEGQIAVLSKEEQAYLDGHPSLDVRYDPANPPFEMTNADGNPEGISIDIMKRISKAVGITFRYVPVEKGSIAKRGPCRDCIYSKMIYDYGWANSHNVLITQPYIEVNYVTVYKKSNTKNIRVALLRGSYLTDIIEKSTLEHGAVTYYDTVEECLDAVERGDEDYTFANAYESEYFLAQPKYHALNLRNLQVESQRLGIGVSKNADPMLYSILAKGLQSISGDELTEIIREHVNHGGETNFFDMLYTNPVQFLAISSTLVLLSAGLAFSLILYADNKKKKNVLESAISVKSNFLSSMSHDMRTPMNAIIGMSYLGMDSADLGEAKQYHKEINQSGQYLLNLINDTLDMSKIEQDKMQFNPEPYYSSEFLESMTTMLQKKADDKGVFLRVEDRSNTDRAALIDKLRLQQIFINLINNAIKFTPPGGTVTFLVESSADADGMIGIRFTVQDTGIGMSEAFQEKMYLPFEQAATAKTSAESGTGLGLAIVQKLVGLMGGEIVCHSALGKGTEFVVTLHAKAVEAPACAAQDALSKEKIQSTLRGKQVLLAEDHPLNTMIAVKLLERMEVTVETAENGEIAVEKFRNAPERHYDAILMDIRMPVLDGLQAAAALRKLDRADAKTIPIIAMTANAFEDDVQKSIDAGMNAHLSKPVDPQKLYAVLTTLLSGKKEVSE